MIKFSARHNLIYIILLILNHLVRRIILIITDTFYPNSVSVFYSVLMFLGEMSAGFILYKYQKIVLKKRIIDEKLTSILTKKFKKSRIDSKFKIYSLLIMSGFFDFMETQLSNLYIPKFSNISKSLEDRLCGTTIIFTALIYSYILKFPLFKHHIFSLVVVGASLLIIIISEAFFQQDKITKSFFGFISLVISSLFEMYFICMMDCIDKYLMEFNSFNPCLIIVFEGLFGTIYSLINFVDNDLYTKTKLVIKGVQGHSIGLFIFLLFLIFVLSGITNIYRIYTNKIYNPMTESLAYYALNPLYMIYDFASADDFLVKEKQDYFYFFFNLILSIIISVTGFIFNEFIVVFCCRLEHDTYQEISKRSKVDKDDAIELGKLLNDKEEEDEEENKDRTYTIFV